MKKFKIVLFAILGIYHVVTVAVLSYMVMDKENIQFLLKIHGQIGLLQWVAIICLILFLILLVLFQRKEKEVQAVKTRYENEITSLKAKLYDKKESEASELASSPGEKEGKDIAPENDDSKEDDSDRAD